MVVDSMVVEGSDMVAVTGVDIVTNSIVHKQRLLHPCNVSKIKECNPSYTFLMNVLVKYGIRQRVQFQGNCYDCRVTASPGTCER